MGCSAYTALKSVASYCCQCMHADVRNIDDSSHSLGAETALDCKPWCLFNLTDDLGERNDLGANPAYQEIAQKIADRLAYHGSTGL